MSFSDDEISGPLVGVAKAVRTRGLKGELVADLLTDFPERFDAVDQLIAVAPNDERKVVDLEDFWFQQDRIILKLRGYDEIETAKSFVGYEFCVPDSERVELDEDEYFDFELEGCEVSRVDGEPIGKVRAILRTGGVEILEVDADGGGEVMIPLAASIVVKVDVAAKQIVIDPPDGLLEL